MGTLRDRPQFVSLSRGRGPATQNSSCSKFSRLRRCSRSDDFFADEMEAEELGLFALVEVTAHRVPDLLVQIVEVVSFGEDRFSQSARRIPALGGLPTTKINSAIVRMRIAAWRPDLPGRGV